MQTAITWTKQCISPLLEDQANYLIFIRPRRFGKSLLLRYGSVILTLHKKISSSNSSAISGSVSMQLRFKANTKYFILTFLPKSGWLLMNCHKDLILQAVQLDGFLNRYREYYTDEFIERFSAADKGIDKLTSLMTKPGD